MGVYNTGKHAVVALTETLYQDLKLVTERVACSVLCPFYVPTGIFLSERNRPGDLTSDAAPTPSQRAAREMGLKATSSGKVSAAEVSTLTFEAIAAKRFYVFSHPSCSAVSRRACARLSRVGTRPMRSPPGPKSARRSAGGCAKLDEPFDADACTFTRGWSGSASPATARSAPC